MGAVMCAPGVEQRHLVGAQIVGEQVGGGPQPLPLQLVKESIQLRAPMSERSPPLLNLPPACSHGHAARAHALWGPPADSTGHGKHAVCTSCTLAYAEAALLWHACTNDVPQ